MWIAVSVYAVAAAFIADLSRDRINPDAIAYIQNARHYLAGRFDLAVNGWFGPLISWLLVPAVWIGGNTIVWFRAYNAVFGVILAAGTMRLTEKLTGGRWGRFAFIAALLLSLGAVGDELTPDLLVGAAFAWYFYASSGLVFGGRPGRAFAVGVLGGLCHLIKAYAGMFAAVHLAMTFLFRWSLARRGRAEGGAGISFAAAIAGLVLAAAPWVTVISRQAGRFTLSTIPNTRESWGPLDTPAPNPVHLLQDVTPGRITNWENPIEIPLPWNRWNASGPWDHAAKMLQASLLNAGSALRMVFRFDLLGLLLIGWAAALIGCFVRRRAQSPENGDCTSASSPRDFPPFPEHSPPSPQGVLRLWACLSVALYVGGLLPIWIVSRYLWPMWPLLLAVFASLLTAVQDRITGRHRLSSLCAQPGQAVPPPAWRRLPAILAGALVVSIVANVAIYVFLDDLGPLKKGREASQLRRLAETANIRGAVVAARSIDPNDGPANWYRGLFTTYWAAGEKGDQAQFLGEFKGRESVWVSHSERSSLPAYLTDVYAYHVGGRSKPSVLLCSIPQKRLTAIIFDDPGLARDLAEELHLYLVRPAQVEEGPPRADVLRFDFTRFSLPPSPPPPFRPAEPEGTD